LRGTFGRFFEKKLRKKLIKKVILFINTNNFCKSNSYYQCLHRRGRQPAARGRKHKIVENIFVYENKMESVGDGALDSPPCDTSRILDLERSFTR